MDDVDQLDATTDSQYRHATTDCSLVEGRFEIISFSVNQQCRAGRPIVESGIDVAASGQQQAVDPVEEFFRIDIGRADPLELRRPRSWPC